LLKFFFKKRRKITKLLKAKKIEGWGKKKPLKQSGEHKEKQQQ
jgi:hypothetical protein